jgi:hypothetical protein
MKTPFNFQGDPKLYLTENGVDISVINGHVEMEQGLINTILIPLFISKEPKHYNDLCKNDDEKIKPLLSDVINRPITANSLLDISSAVKASLSVLISRGFAKTIDVKVENKRGMEILLTITVDSNKILIVKKDKWQVVN